MFELLATVGALTGVWQLCPRRNHCSSCIGQVVRSSDRHGYMIHPPWWTCSALQRWLEVSLELGGHPVGRQYSHTNIEHDLEAVHLCDTYTTRQGSILWCPPAVCHLSGGLHIRCIVERGETTDETQVFFTWHREYTTLKKITQNVGNSLNA